MPEPADANVLPEPADINALPRTYINPKIEEKFQQTISDIKTVGEELKTLRNEREEQIKQNEQLKKQLNLLSIENEALQHQRAEKDVKPIVEGGADENRHKILVIRNYINHFEEQLKSSIISEFGNKTKMFKRLYDLNSSQLDNIIQQIRVELISNKSVHLFHNIADMAIMGIEKSSGWFGMDLSGLSTNAKNDAQLQSAITQLGCEYSIDLPPKKQIVLSLAYNITTTHSINMKKKQEANPTTLSDVLTKHKINIPDASTK